MDHKRNTTMLVAGIAALSLAACGGGGDSTASSGSSSRESFREAQLAFAKCMRENGVDIPDPKPGQRGFQVIGPGPGEDSAKSREALEKCQKHLDSFEPPELTKEQQAALRDNALAQSRCMRSKGIDIPDPQFDSRGRVTIRPPKNVNPMDPKVRDAFEECRREVGPPKGLPKPEAGG
jgi:hypothetical protein